ncbi:acyl transferase/acyl hydrolase/lysophospholipase [Lyophyllum atratum]|nr:acyl transferase/acyl hydrolase/lysophospholipase [Lyophyllum atratum]
MSFTIQEDKYIVATTDPCDIICQDNKVASQIWFRTPALEQSLIDQIVDIQLETKSRHQGWVTVPEAGSWSWFDIIVLDSPAASDIKVKDSLALAWLSHDNKLGINEDTRQVGPALGSKHDIYNSLEAGNALAVRVCARFPGWENHASEGRLILKVSEKGRHAQPSMHGDKAAYLKIVNEQMASLGATTDAYLNAATPADAPPMYSLVREMLPTGPLRADQMGAADKPPVRLASFDGGGVRGISSLYILKAIMAKLSSDPDAKPCQYFDMIAGTSTGGLIAIMLGRLQMTIPECIQAYMTLAQQTFSANALEKIWDAAHTAARYTKDNFEKGLKALIKQKTGDENALMLDPDTNNHCKVFVLAVRTQNTNHTSAEHFRTYSVDFTDPFPGKTCPIWQAARATSAAPLYLPSITINGIEFVDGGMKFNNPSLMLMCEFGQVFGLARRIKCLLSIGTGMAPISAMKKQPTNLTQVPFYWKRLSEVSVEIATECEDTHRYVQGLHDWHEDAYFRFNAGQKQGDNWASLIELDDWEGMPQFVAVTQTWLGGETKEIEQCALKLAA